MNLPATPGLERKPPRHWPPCLHAISCSTGTQAMQPSAAKSLIPVAYNLLPKDRIGHCHVKDVMRNNNDYEWAAMGKGIINWSGQFAALKHDGYPRSQSRNALARCRNTRSLFTRMLARNPRRPRESRCSLNRLFTWGQPPLGCPWHLQRMIRSHTQRL
jgi:hypothetical protein